MAPNDPRRRGPPGPFGGEPFGDDFRKFFEEFERQFARDFEHMHKLMGDVFQDAMKVAERTKPGEPFVYGFKLRMGADGKPQFESFGNTQNVVSAEGAAPGLTTREPMTDVIVGETQVAVTAEIPGVEKEEINLHVATDKVTIRVPAGERHGAYYKEIRLPAAVKPDTSAATYKNGILDITITRASPGNSGTRVPIK